jgi:2-keto-4-pentenoate hydratase/2-oxohepta-3-ene-1,7-dioic acid hydratase in catechol pathway
MRFARYGDGGGVTHGVLTDDGIVPLGGTGLAPVTFERLANDAYLDRVRERVRHAPASVDPASVRMLAPVPTPGKIVCVGLNYHDHAEEQGEEVPERPLLFGKAPTSVTNPGDPIVRPADVDELDYEVELAVVIGREARHVSAADAQSYVAGYTVCNDVSGRDVQFSDGQYFRGKSYDTFSPLGPTLAADGVDPNALDVSLRLNGETMQSSNTDQFVFDVDEVVAYVSRAMTLRPGDVISTGTPGGVGVFRDPQRFLEPGDEVVAEIEGIGELRNHVVDE